MLIKPIVSDVVVVVRRRRCLRSLIKPLYMKVSTIVSGSETDHGAPSLTSLTK